MSDILANTNGSNFLAFWRVRVRQEPNIVDCCAERCTKCHCELQSRRLCSCIPNDYRRRCIDSLPVVSNARMQNSANVFQTVIYINVFVQHFFHRFHFVFFFLHYFALLSPITSNFSNHFRILHICVSITYNTKTRHEDVLPENRGQSQNGTYDMYVKKNSRH